MITDLEGQHLRRLQELEVRLKAEEDRRVREQEELLRLQKETEEERRRREWEAEVHRV